MQSAGAVDRRRLGQASSDFGPQVGGVGRREVGAVDAPAGEHPFVRHEVVAAVAPAHQQAWLLRIAPDDDQRIRFRTTDNRNSHSILID